MKQKKKRTIDIQFITATISTALVLLLLGTVALFVLTANNLSVYVRENLQMSVLLQENASERDVNGLIKRLTAKPYAKEVAFISKDSILAQETRAMGIDPTEFLGLNPYTASVEVSLKADYANNDSLRWIEKSLREDAIVTDISYPHDLVNNINSNIKKISIVLMVLALALLLISFALINNTIRLTIYSQRFLLHTMKLVGANWGFIRKPFMVRNFWIGLIAGILAILMLAGGMYAMLRYEPMLVTLLDLKTMLIVAAVILAFGILITMLCARISINRFLRMKAGDLYYI
ncbi:MAG: permease-like cell division protein FtsX [Bacteroidaceae bacterium]|nr:permease-like cell division protein FtsX [Bacteroidaceae bacterium]